MKDYVKATLSRIDFSILVVLSSTIGTMLTAIAMALIGTIIGIVLLLIAPIDYEYDISVKIMDFVMMRPMCKIVDRIRGVDDGTTHEEILG